MSLVAAVSVGPARAPRAAGALLARPVRSRIAAAVLGAILGAAPGAALALDEEPAAPDPVRARFDALDHRLDQLEKAIDDVLWYHRVGDVAAIDKVYIYGPPPARIESETAMGAKNPVKFWSYVFVPHGLDRARRHPLIVFPHGGVHANFTTYYTHVVREMVAQGYVVVAPEYRGSTGYGRGFYERIDYGGREVDDNHAARDFAIEAYDFVDAGRVGVVGWSHGGLIALLDAFAHPRDYQAVFAGVPVSDLVARMGYHEDDYRELFSADHHIGKTAFEDVAEYRRRSPVHHVDKLEAPLLVHTNTNDDDVNVLEVEHLIAALKAAGKSFEYEIFEDAPGGHSFDRIDTPAAREIRLSIYRFLARHLKPERPFASVAELSRAAYR